MELISNIKNIREEKELTQFQLSELTGITVNQISLYENNKAYPSFLNAWMIADVLNCLLDELYSEK